jgi:hypothetical protein
VTYTIRLDDGTSTITLRPAAPSGTDPYICTGETLASAAPREAVQAFAGKSGVNDLTQFHDAAVFQATLYIQDSGGITRHQYIDQLRAMLRPANRPYLYLQRDGWLTERRALVRGASLTAPIDRLSGTRVETSLQVTIPAGVLESAVLSSDNTRPGSTSSGRTYPRTDPWSYTPGASGATKFLTVGGGEVGATDTPLLMRLYGACTEPVITNVTLGEVFELDNVTLADGQYLEIDMDAKTVLLNGDTSLSYYNKINFTTSTWWQLQPGTNQLLVGAASLDTTCELDFEWRDHFAI